MNRKMKQFAGILILAAILFGISSCSKTTIRKPEQLIPKTKFEKMMVDIYLIQGFNNGMDRDSTLKNITQTDLYYSVLNKYSVPDTVFIRTLIYYSSFPKEYEKMHVQIMNYLNESEQQFKPKEKLKVDTE
jgi:hypothetical protein